MTKLIKFIGDLILNANSRIMNGIPKGYKQDLLALFILAVIGFFLWATLKFTNLEYIKGNIPRWFVYDFVLFLSMIFLGVKLFMDKVKEKQLLDSKLISEAMARDTDEYRMKNELYLDFSEQRFEEEERYSKFISDAMARDTDEYRMENELYLDFSEQGFKEEELNSELISEAMAKDTDQYRIENEVYPELYSLEYIVQEPTDSIEIKEAIEKEEKKESINNRFTPSKKPRYKSRSFDRDNEKLEKIFPSPEDLDNFCKFLNSEELLPSAKINITSYPGSRQRNVKTIFCLLHYCLGDFIEDISGAKLEALINDICKYFTNNGHPLYYESLNSAFSNWRGYLLEDSSNDEREKIVRENNKIAEVFQSKPQ